MNVEKAETLLTQPILHLAGVLCDYVALSDQSDQFPEIRVLTLQNASAVFQGFEY